MGDARIQASDRTPMPAPIERREPIGPGDVVGSGPGIDRSCGVRSVSISSDECSMR
jgi:hypothetical protein